MSTKKLKFGILCNSLTLQKWQADAISHLLKDPHFELSLVIINNHTPTKVSYLKKIFSSTLLFRQYETRILKVTAKQGINIQEDFEGVEQLKVTPIFKGKYSQYFNDEDTEHIKNKGLDFIIRLGFGILKGEILNAAKYGIWSYHHGDEKEFRGGPPGFWEIYRNTPTTSCILQRLTLTLDGGVILKKGTFKTTNHSYSYHLNTLFSHTSIWIKQVGLDIIYNDRVIDETAENTEKLPINKAPTNSVFILFLLKLLLNKIQFWFNSLFQVELWSIGILENKKSDLFTDIKLKANWLEDKKKLSYRADPFIATINNNKVIFFERYNYSEKKGHIAAIQLKEPSTEQEILKTQAHFSYPFLFKESGEVYCLPEAYMSRAAVLHTISNDLKLGETSTILSGVEAIDSSLLYYNNKYWLFCTINNALHNAQLFIFYSDSLEKEFTPHLLNPVKTEITSARPAGSFFEFEGSIIRPSQNCSETYGGSLMLNKISILTETDYKEETIKEVKPLPDIYSKGIHHISIEDETIVIDGKKYIYSLPQAIKRLFG